MAKKCCVYGFVLVAAFFGFNGIQQVSLAENATALDRFQIFKDGDALLVPVEVEGKSYSFMVDTGCGTTTFDPSLLKSDPRGTGRVATISDTIAAQSYPVPHARLGRHKLESELESIIAVDMSGFRQKSGHRIYGALGMDFLGKYVVCINFEDGILELLAENPDNARAGVAIPLAFDKHGTPTVTAQVEGAHDAEFEVDTGFVSFGTGTLDSRACEYGSRLGYLNEVGSQHFVGAAGAGNSRVFRATSFMLGGQRIADPILSESNRNRLGLYYLSRFHVTLDFPSKIMYLRKSNAFPKSDGRTLSGMTLLRNEGEVVVGSVTADGAASKAGICEGDTIIRIGRLDADKSRMFELAEQMVHINPSLEVSLRRNGREHKTTVELK